MTLGRQRASVEGVRVDEGNERGRDGTWTAGGRKRAEEGLSEEWRGSKGGKLQGRYPEEGTGLYTVYTVPVYSIFTNHPTTRPLPLILCYYK